MTKPKVFISYSGAMSKAISELIHTWLKHTLQTVELLYTPAFIQPGQRIHLMLFEALAQADIALLIYTKEGLNCSRMVFEAGYVCKAKANGGVISLLFGLTPEVLPEPINAFQCEVFSNNGMWRIIKGINGQLREQRIDEDTLKHVFDREWGGLVQDVDKIMQQLSAQLLNSARLAAGFPPNEGHSATATQQLLKQQQAKAQQEERTRQTQIQLQSLYRKKSQFAKQLRKLQQEIIYAKNSLQYIDQRYQQYQLLGSLGLWAGAGTLGFLVYSSGRIKYDGVELVDCLWLVFIMVITVHFQFKINPILNRRREIQRFRYEYQLVAKKEEELTLKQEIRELLALIKELETAQQQA